ncbi:MAG: TIGR02391 family protein [Pseudomonadota bacterium]
MKLADLIPDEQLLISLPAEEVGRQLLRLARDRYTGRHFSKEGIAGRDNLFDSTFDPNRPGSVYSSSYRDEILLSVAEGWQWLESQGLIMPAAAPNESYTRFTRIGLRLAEDESRFDAYLSTSQFPKSLIHESIMDDVWIQLAQGKYDVAVFIAFRAVEEAVRDAAGYNEEEHGVPMIRRAFHKTDGPLTKLSDPMAEREALLGLVAGAVGSYKNPHSHRTVGLSDASEAQEMIVLASHLLRIIEGRTTN